jgi:hypothetical protein
MKKHQSLQTNLLMNRELNLSLAHLYPKVSIHQPLDPMQLTLNLILALTLLQIEVVEIIPEEEEVMEEVDLVVVADAIAVEAANKSCQQINSIRPLTQHLIIFLKLIHIYYSYKTFGIFISIPSINH